MTTMRSIVAVCVSTIVLCVTLAASAATPPPVRIMPLGDSITLGVPVAGGYRAPLYASLTNLGYAVDYVGTQTGNGVASLPDSDHEGHSGWTIGGINGSLLGFLNAVSDPDVVLLHLGTNDANDSGSFADAINRLDALITNIATNRPYAHIIVTTLLPRTETDINTSITTLFNPYVQDKVNAQAALGRRVTFLDMHAYLTTDDLTDTAHPNQTGYNKMADAWLSAITNVIAPTGDREAPALVRAQALASAHAVVLTFSKPVSPATATNLSNYAVSGGLTLAGASLDASQRSVTLTTGLQAARTSYTVTVNNVADLTSPSPIAVAADSTVTFTAATPRGYLNNVAESADYTLVYSLDIPNAVNYATAAVPYSTDNHFAIGSFSRVAYYMELQTSSGDLTYVWASMDAFTNDTALIGVPTLQSGAVFVKSVSNLTVDSNVAGVDIGSGFTGNLEFYPYRYEYANSAGVSGASDTTCDFGDAMKTDGYYGSMQVHNTTRGKTIFAFNRWCGMGLSLPELGIGNQPTGDPDWTFSSNTYIVKTLQVLVLRGSDTVPPTLVSAQSDFARTNITVRFSEPLAPSSVNGTCFSLDNGVQVIGAALAANQRDVILFTTRQPIRDLTLTVTGIRDSAAGNPIVPNSVLVIPVLPTAVTANVGGLATNYQLVCSLDIPVVGNFNNGANPYSFDQRSGVGTFDRVAYYLELEDANGIVHFIWTSMDAFTTDAAKLGIPVIGTAFQQVVTNLDVLSNVGGIVNGTGITTGCIEFWPSNYEMANGLNIPNASGTAYDFGDSNGDSSSAGHGCMQVHNYGASQTLFAINHFNNGNTIAVGIGNNPDANLHPDYPDPDWTATYNAGTYLRRTLHVLVRPVSLALPAEVVANVPQSVDYKLACTISLPVYGHFDSSTADYITDNRATLGIFSRIAYFLELKKVGETTTNFVWASMDAFTTDAAKLGIPVAGTYFQQKVARLAVFSNVGGVISGTGISTGNIEFFPSDFSMDNGLGIPNANGSMFDFGDSVINPSSTGYGCLQIHDYGAKQTLLAINHFNSGSKLAIGIGNNPNLNPTYPDPDWTATYNADLYDLRVLHILVLPGTAPTLVAAVPSTALNSVVVSFNEPLADSAADIRKFAINNGVTVNGAALLSDKKSVLLNTTSLTPEQTYAVSVTGVCDRSVSGCTILDGSSIAFTVQAASLPNAIAGNIPELGNYALVYRLAIPNYSDVEPYGSHYSFDESLFPQVRAQSFDRVAYCLELVTGGVTQWAYVSMDAFTLDITKIGVPTHARGAVFQQRVNNMNVYASDNAAVTTGVGIATGNIEFWPSSYGPENTLGIPYAVSGQVFDFGDSGGSTDAGHGSMQIHNYGNNAGEGHTILSFSRFGMNGLESALGIGNNTVFTYGSGYEDPDWTLHPDATTFTTKNLYVLAHWSGSTQGTSPSLLSQPADRTVRTGESVRFFVHALDATTYQWRHNGVAIDGANQAWLEIGAAALTDSGTYDVLVYGASTATSQSANLHVIARGTVLSFK